MIVEFPEGGGSVFVQPQTHRVMDSVTVPVRVVVVVDSRQPVSSASLSREIFSSHPARLLPVPVRTVERVKSVKREREIHLFHCDHLKTVSI